MCKDKLKKIMNEVDVFNMHMQSVKVDGTLNKHQIWRLFWVKGYLEWFVCIPAS
jgi:hypothetical protein